MPKDGIVANINMDMFLPLFPMKTLMVLGLDESDLGDDVRDSADVVFVAVRQHERRGAPFLLQVGHVRNDAIDAQLIGVREHDTRVDDHGGIAPREREHVHTELAKSAERNDFEH